MQLLLSLTLAQVLQTWNKTIQIMDKLKLDSNAGVVISTERNFSILRQDHALVKISKVTRIVYIIQYTRNTLAHSNITSINCNAFPKTMNYMVTSTVVKLLTLSSNLRNALGQAVETKLKYRISSGVNLCSQCKMVKNLSMINMMIPRNSMCLRRSGI